MAAGGNQFVNIVNHGTIVKPKDFHGKRDEDAEDWLLDFINVANANRWDDA